jgi:hypothetical protein
MNTVIDSLKNKVNEFIEKLNFSNLNVKQWYDEYLGRTMHANKLLMEEVDRVRSRVISTESS